MSLSSRRFYQSLKALSLGGILLSCSLVQAGTEQFTNFALSTCTETRCYSLKAPLADRSPMDVNYFFSKPSLTIYKFDKKTHKMTFLSSTTGVSGYYDPDNEMIVIKKDPSKKDAYDAILEIDSDVFRRI